MVKKATPFLLLLAVGSFTVFINRSVGGPAFQPVAVGLVDMEKLLQNYEAFKRDDEGFRTRIVQIKLALNARRLLEKAEWDELDQLERKESEGKITAEEKARLQKLRQLTDERQAEIDSLRVKPNLTDEDRKRLTYLQTLQKDNESRLMELQQQKEQELGQIRESLTHYHRQRIRDAAAKVAQDLGLKLILYDQEEVVLYGDGSLNVTDQIVSRLNAGERK